jgi:hypothetical protein
MKTTIERLPFPIAYSEVQRVALAEGVADAKPDPSGWMQHYRDGVFFERFNHQLFAVFGRTAYQLVCQRLYADDGAVIEYLPAVVDGHALYRSPDEGCDGVLHIMRFVEHPRRPSMAGKWRPVWIHGGWLRTEELMLSVDEIRANIVAEVLRGETPITGGGLPGWA